MYLCYYYCILFLYFQLLQTDRHDWEREKERKRGKRDNEKGHFKKNHLDHMLREEKKRKQQKREQYNKTQHHHNNLAKCK